MIDLKDTNVILTGATGGIGNSTLENLILFDRDLIFENRFDCEKSSRTKVLPWAWENRVWASGAAKPAPGSGVLGPGPGTASLGVE